MSVSAHIVGFMPVDAIWKKMKQAYDACEEAGVSVPEEVATFFGDGNPKDPGREVDLEKSGCLKEYRDDSLDGFEVDLSKVPTNVKIIRFYNSY